mmetsp:Transcript_7696/g.8888  ORF Transcript_7696/g.8888 Transcript_7696/m.8888 type:complete len:198 (+) Transcript_7696:73-666(+)
MRNIPFVVAWMMIMQYTRAFSVLRTSRVKGFSGSIIGTRSSQGSLRTIRIVPSKSVRMNMETGEGNEGDEGARISVTGPVYTIDGNHPTVQLYTKEGCTLCDKVSDVLRSIQQDHPHSLEAIDITDDDKTDAWDKYKWDIPVLHINGEYWTKHRLEVGEAQEALTKAQDGTFEKQKGEPNAAAMEKRMAARCLENET